MKYPWKQKLYDKYPEGVFTTFHLAGSGWVGDIDQRPAIVAFIELTMKQLEKEIQELRHEPFQSEMSFGPVEYEKEGYNKALDAVRKLIQPQK